MDYRELQESLKELSFVDEANAYEVDEAGIYLNPENGKYHLITASGCSCWDDDDYDEEIFDTLELLEKALMDNDRTYNPSLKGAQYLLEKAKESILLNMNLTSNLPQ